MDMSRYERKEFAKEIAQAFLNLLDKRHELANSKPKYVKVKDACRIVGRSRAWMYKNKNLFPYKKLGDTKQGQLLFPEDALYKFLQ